VFSFFVTVTITTDVTHRLTVNPQMDLQQFHIFLVFGSISFSVSNYLLYFLTDMILPCFFQHKDASFYEGSVLHSHWTCGCCGGMWRNTWL